MNYYLENKGEIYQVPDMGKLVAALSEEELCSVTIHAIFSYEMHKAINELIDKGILEVVEKGDEPSLEEYEATMKALKDAVLEKYGFSRLAITINQANLLWGENN